MPFKGSIRYTRDIATPRKLGSNPGCSPLRPTGLDCGATGGSVRVFQSTKSSKAQSGRFNRNIQPKKTTEGAIEINLFRWDIPRKTHNRVQFFFRLEVIYASAVITSPSSAMCEVYTWDTWAEPVLLSPTLDWKTVSEMREKALYRAIHIKPSVDKEGLSFRIPVHESFRIPVHEKARQDRPESRGKELLGNFLSEFIRRRRFPRRQTTAHSYCLCPPPPSRPLPLFSWTHTPRRQSHPKGKSRPRGDKSSLYAYRSQSPTNKKKSFVLWTLDRVQPLERPQTR